jgi:hypothetical protein
MGINEPRREIHVGDVKNMRGNFAIGDGNIQQILSSEPQLTDHLQRLVDQIRGELARTPDLPGAPAAEEALTEITEILADGPVPSRPQRMERARGKLMRALDGITSFATPLVQLTAAIEELLRAKP